MRRNLFALLIIIICVLESVVVMSQTTKEQSKYHVIDISELANIQKSLNDFTETPPPTGDIKSIAEFEKMQGVIVSYRNSFGIPVDAIAEMSQDAIVYTITQDQTTADDIYNYYSNNGVNLANSIFVLAPLNSYWSRDYSPWFIREHDRISIVDFPYNRPRPKDDDIPIVMADYFNVDLYGMPIIHTGGNYMTDGMGKGASTQLVIEENPGMSVPELQQTALNYLGLDEYEFLDDPLDEYIEHIDCWAKFLAVDKILIGSIPETDYRFADYEALADYYENKLCSYGTPYKVFRTYSPDDQPYTNSLILNDKIFVPIVDGNGSAWNDSAISIYQDAMPGYEIIGVEETSYINWYNTDAFHCRTHGVPDLGMLHINHIPWHGEKNYELNGYNISCEIIAYSDSVLVPDSLRIYYKTQSAGYGYANLILDSGNIYTANLTGLDYSDTVQYYISVYDNSGRSATHPFVGEVEPHSFYIEEYVQSIVYDKEEELFKVFPNPTTGVVYIKSDYSFIQIFSLEGKLVEERDVNNLYERIDLSSIAKGVYFVKAFKDNSSVVERLIVY